MILRMNALLTNASVYTVNPRQPRATAIAIANDRIVAVGSDAEINAISLPDLKRIDMRGAFILPGLIDAHLHLQHSGIAMQRVDLSGCASKQEALERVRARVAVTPPGQWVQGRGWRQNDWTPPDFPTARDLDTVAPDHPVALSAHSGHALWANTRALQLAGIGAHTQDTPGGELVRDAQGMPTGIFLETADRLVLEGIPQLSEQQADDAVSDVMRAMNRVGLTGVHCLDGDHGIDTFKTYQRVLEQRRATLRVVKMLPVQALDAVIDAGWRSGFGGDWLRVGNVKIFADGALGPKTAWMVDPYIGEPENRGLKIYDPEQLIEFTHKAHGAGLGVAVHAIGDRANHEMLNAIALSRTKLGAQPRRFRDRIEHAQVLIPDDIKRFATLDVIASMQPIHCTSDMAVADAIWGPARTPYAYAMQTLWRSGARLALGSDAPIESFDPRTGIYAAVTRKRADGSHAPDGWQPQECLSIDQAIYGYTLGAAYAGYMEHATGSIEPGKLADLTVLSHDLTAIPAEQILTVQIQRVMVGGAWVFES